MKSRFLWLLCLLLAFTSRPASAFWGIGDITFDPTTYAEVSRLYSSTMDLYKTAKDQLKTLSDMQQTLKQAQEGVDALKNFDLKKSAHDLAPGNLDGKSDKINAMRAELSNLEGKLGSNTGYVSYQLQRIKNLETLEMLQKQSAGNLDKASDKTSADANSKITAQSTATLAALAAAEQQRKEEEKMAAAKDVDQQRRLVGESAKIYDALGKE